jgi:hypothetical protein
MTTHTTDLNSGKGQTRPPSEWMAEAGCVGVQDLPWTTDTHDRTGPAVLGQIMADTCATCPVRVECAAYAAENDICGGFWAGSDRALPQPSERPSRRRKVWVPIPNTGGRVIEEQAAFFPGAGDAA